MRELAPVVVAAEALAREVLALPGSGPASERAAGVALDLHEALALALTFPHERDDQLRAADRAVVRLRLALRLRDAELPAGLLRVLHERLDDVGRQIGGWRRARARRSAKPRGDGPTPRRGG